MTVGNHLNHLAKIKSQEIELSILDLAMFRLKVDSIYLYKNKLSNPNFMPLDVLAESLCLLIADHYPILVGRPTVNSAGKGIISIDSSNLCLPDIAEIIVDSPVESFFETCPNDSEDKSDIQFFNTRRFYCNSGVAHPPHASYHRDHSAVIVRVLRFKDDSYVGISYSMSHCIFDGIGAMAFVNHWGEYARNLEEIKNGKYQLVEPPLNDRQVLNDCFSKVEPLDLPFVSYFKGILPPLPEISPAAIASSMLSTPDLQAIEDLHVLHFSRANLERIRHHVDKDQTINVAFVTLLTKNMVQANIKAFGKAPQATYVMTPYNCRAQSTIPKHFVGNATCPAIAPLSTQLVLDGSYKDLAESIRELCSKTESGHTKANMLLIEHQPSLLFHIFSILCNSSESSYISMTNLRYMPFYTLDFGYGEPSVLGFDYFQMEGTVRLLPNKQDDGLDLYLTFHDAHFDELCQLEDIKLFANVIY
ncbi:transferase [Kickxella alabastrina]|uniref:transferase n=1 Tax=Kickxella alabastrina TaxID=61397 RepID=UPI00221E7C8D|nr:transferase [Kickxella alabastrina]KAI7824571.1 transferase [Kickxella alabastrina]